LLSIGKIKLSGEGYYLAAVAEAIDEYYAGWARRRVVGSAPAGHGLGLAGEVDADDLHAVWAGTNPASGERLGRSRSVGSPGSTSRSGPRSPCRCSPRSVIPTRPRSCADAHETAVDAALSFSNARRCGPAPARAASTRSRCTGRRGGVPASHQPRR